MPRLSNPNAWKGCRESWNPYDEPDQPDDPEAAQGAEEERELERRLQAREISVDNSQHMGIYYQP